MSVIKNMLVIKTKKVHYSILIVWAALSAAAMLIPGIPTLGSGSSMSLTYPLSPLAGILFGPYAGALCTAVGGIIGTIIAPHAANLGIWTFTVQTVTAFMAGYISRGKWQLPTVFFLIMTGVVYTFQAIQEVWWFGWVYLSGILMAIIGALWCSKILRKSGNVFLKAVGVFIISYAAFISGCTVSDPLGIIMFDLTSELYVMLAVMMPFERVMFSLFTAILGVPLLMGLPKIKIYVGPEFDDMGEKSSDMVDEQMKNRYK